MAKIDAIDIPKLLFAEGAAPGTPASGKVHLYAKADGLFYSKDDAGVETVVTGGAAASPTWTSWTPTITQSGSVAATVEHAHHSAIGAVTHFRASLLMSAAGTINNPIVIGGQPAALQDVAASTNASCIIGHAILRDEGTGYYMCNLIAYSATAWRLIPYNLTGYAGQTPNMALASGDRVVIHGTVRTS